MNLGAKCLMLFAAPFLFQSPALALQPQPLLKQGSCPNGYNTSGSYCVPTVGARFAVHKNGICPNGYNTSGSYCLATPNAKLAIPKRGNCPVGYSVSGDYCLKAK
ncbi:MAG: hypothetical protein FJY51_06785 [Betaproteobacteria bacterium]|nr:hypothetical protein [Betaproteobacteria bacterium]